MNRSDRNPDAYDRIREDTSVLGRTCGYCNFTGDMMSYAHHVCPRDVMQSEIDSLRAQLAAATERSGARGERLYNLEYAIYQIGRRLVYDELDEGDQESIGKELIFLSTFCDYCKGQGMIGDGEGDWYDCDKCKGSGTSAVALAAAQPASEPENNNG